MEQLTKEQLLAKAKEKYPKGTEFISVLSKLKATVRDGWTITGDGDLFVTSMVDGYVSIYHKSSDTWAEIISTPKHHDGYIVPFDIFGGNLKEGTIIKLNVGKDFETGIETWDSGNGENWILPIEWVETWEKHYPETTEETKPDICPHFMSVVCDKIDSLNKHQMNRSVKLYVEVFNELKKHYNITKIGSQQTAKPDYSKVIELIEGEIEVHINLIKGCLSKDNYNGASNYASKSSALTNILTKIKAL